MENKVLRQRLVAQLFKSSGDEKLLFSCTIQEQNKDEPSDVKARILALTTKKSRTKLLKLKSSGITFIVTKSWGLEEIKSIELGDGECMLNVMVGSKMCAWVFADLRSKIEFMYTIIKMSAKEGRKLAKLINFDEEMIQDQMAALQTMVIEKPQEDASTTLTENLDDDEDIQSSVDLELPPVDLALILADFNWSASIDASALEASLVSELQALEAANVHDIIQSETHANLVVSHVDRTLEELSVITNWLSHYTGLLAKMGNDVHQIETQNKGMQVTSNNQTALLAELESFLASLKVQPSTLEALKNEPLDSMDGVLECEKAVEKVMKIIGTNNGELNEMSAMKERIGWLQGHINAFATRLCEYLTGLFTTLSEFYLNDKTRASQRGALKLGSHEGAESKLYKFRRLLMWLKDVDVRKHYELQMMYVKELARTYNREIRDFLEVLKNLHLQKKAVEDSDFLFSSTGSSNVIKNAIGVTAGASNAIKTAISDKPKKLDMFKKKKKKEEEEDDDGRSSIISTDPPDDQKMTPDEALAHVLLKLTNIMVREQNFITDLFGLIKKPIVILNQSLDDLGSRVDSSSNDLSRDEEETLEQWQTSLSTVRRMHKDAKGDKRIMELMDFLFQDVRELLMSIIEIGTKYDQSVIIGMMVHIETHVKEYAGSGHSYMNLLLETLLKRTVSIFDKFVTEQVKAIDDTRVTTKKRGGILVFVRVFPRFVDRVERMLSTWDGTTRKLVDKAYVRIIKTIFDSIDAESQDVATTANITDEKDSLNKHILIVENMHHFHSEVRARKVNSLEGVVKQAKILYDVNLEAYSKVVLRKPLGKLLEFFEGVETLLKTGPADEVSYHVQYSKTALKDVIKKYPGKEIKKSLEVLYRRVDKHFPEEEGLLQVVWRSIQEEFCRQLRKYEELITKCYPDITMRLDFSLEELLGYFSELAQAH